MDQTARFTTTLFVALLLLPLHAIADAESRSFSIIATTTGFSKPLVVATHRATTRMRVEVFATAANSPPYRGWLMYTDATGRPQKVALLNRMEINTANTVGQVSVSLQCTGPRAQVYSVKITTLTVAARPAQAEPSQSFVVIAPTGSYSKPLVIAKHSSAARLKVELFTLPGVKPVSFYSKLRYTDRANRVQEVKLVSPMEIETADTAGSVTVSLKSADKLIGMFSVRVSGQLIGDPSRVVVRSPRDREAIKTALKETENDETRRRIKELDELLRNLPKPPGSVPPAARPAPPSRSLPSVPVNGVIRVGKKAAKVRVLMVVDSRADNIGPAMRINEVNLRHALETGLGNAIDRTLLIDSQVTPKVVRDYYRNLKDKRLDLSNETLVFYYCGHGATRGREHVLTMQQGELRRRELEKLIQDCKPGLAVIITDCCANYIQSNADEQLALVIRPQQAGSRGQPILRDLLLYHRGVVSVNACKEGQVTWCDPFNGGHFTKAFLDACNRSGPFGTLNNPDGFTTWGRFFAEVQVNAMRMPRRVAPYVYTQLNKE